MASIFWGFYESAEIRFVEKYIDGKNDIIELGGSIGIVSSHICSKLETNKKLVTVEVNPNLIELIGYNVKRHLNRGAHFILENKAVSYSSHQVALHLTTNNTETRIFPASAIGSDERLLETTTVQSLLFSNGIIQYDLICDIEGSEIEFILNDKEALKGCRRIIIELHQTNYNGREYSIDVMVELIQREHGFALFDRHGPVFYFFRT